MRRAVARGRVFPQSYSIDRRYGRLSLKAVALFPLIWVNADDQGRLCGDPEEIKYSCCPNIDHITKVDVPGVLKELENNGLILRYDTPKSPAIQIIDWWDPHRSPQWAWPSDYQPPEGWLDHLRYKKDAKTVLTLNWPVSGEDTNSSQASTNNLSGEHSGEETEDTQVSADNRSGEALEKPCPFPQTPIPPLIKGKGKGGRRGRGRGNSPEDSAEHSGDEPSPSPTSLSRQEREVYDSLLENYRLRFGRPLPPDYQKIKPRKPGYRELAQLRDLAKEISAAGGCEFPMVKKAFDEASGQHKQHISYVRAVLLDWLGVERVHST